MEANKELPPVLIGLHLREKAEEWFQEELKKTADPAERTDAMQMEEAFLGTYMAGYKAAESSRWKLHVDLLQQEYEALQRWKEEAKVLLNPIFEYAEKHPDMKIGGSMVEFVLGRCKEYDKLKGENERLKEESKEAKDAAILFCNRNNESQTAYADLVDEHAALKEKADVLMSAVNKAYGTLMGGRRRDTADTLNILNKASCAYNSKNNQNDNT